MADRPDTDAVDEPMRRFTSGADAAAWLLDTDAHVVREQLTHLGPWRAVTGMEALDRLEARLSEYEQALRELDEAARAFARSIVEGNTRAAGQRMDAALVAARAALSGKENNGDPT